MSTACPTPSYAGKTPLLDQPYWDMVAGKTPRQKRTTALPVITAITASGAARRLSLRATTRVDHSGIADQTFRSESSHGYTLTLAGSVGLRHP